MKSKNNDAFIERFSKMYFSGCFILAIAAIVFGFLAPFLISSDNTILVIVGFLVVVFTVFYLVKKSYEYFNRFIKNKLDKGDEND